jgi:hypothetical protein
MKANGRRIPFCVLFMIAIAFISLSVFAEMASDKTYSVQGTPKINIVRSGLFNICDETSAYFDSSLWPSGIRKGCLNHKTQGGNDPWSDQPSEALGADKVGVTGRGGGSRNI